MASNYFRFKQFTVIQNKAAMKVGTDGVLLGSWVDVESVERVLDIGTGSGLIALMIAQRNSTCIVDAIDIDGGACIQANENFKMSMWGRRLNVFNLDLQHFSSTQTGKYDLIVCNPPFFTIHLCLKMNSEIWLGIMIRFHLMNFFIVCREY